MNKYLVQLRAFRNELDPPADEQHELLYRIGHVCDHPQMDPQIPKKIVDHGSPQIEFCGEVVVDLWLMSVGPPGYGRGGGTVESLVTEFNSCGFEE